MTITDKDSEQKKWDDYYATLPVLPEDEMTRVINEEFVEIVTSFLPNGTTLEAGCGAGWQSLALARSGRFQVSLMDFSQEALRHSRKIFEQFNLPATWLCGDALQIGKPEYDLVFNAGVLEHYTFKEQVDYLKSMASRSKRYVLALLPNRMCYWYWIWRVQDSVNNEWPYGKEIPLMDMSEVFREANLHFIGQKFVGHKWTENFINNINGISDATREHILTVHRSKILEPSHTGYLLAALGSVNDEPGHSDWLSASLAENRIVTELSTSLADAIALTLQSGNAMRNQSISYEQQLSDQRNSYEQQLADQRNSNEQLQKQLSEIYSSKKWKIAQRLGRLRDIFIPNGSWMERALGLNANRAPSRLGCQLPMDYYSYAFVRYKRQRRRMFDQHLAGKVSLPGTVPGMVSIILPVYNGADMVGESIKSILAQTYSNFELIIINDGSSDSTASILDEYASIDNRIIVIHQNNQKLPRTLSNGIQMARGEFITWTSDDNHLKPYFLEKMVAGLQEQTDQDMIYANEDIIGENGEPLKNSAWYSGYQQPPGSEHIYLPENPSQLNIYPNNYVGAAFLYRNYVSWLLGDYSSIRFTTEDYDYWMQVNNLFTLRHAPFKEPVYDYRFHSRSLTAKDKELKITENRSKLMAFDDFRRDFILTPMIWIVETDNTSLNLGQETSRILQNSGQKILNRQELETSKISSLWHPILFLWIGENSEAVSFSKNEIPEGAFKVWIHTGSGKLSDKVSSEWNLCIHLGSYTQKLPGLPQKFQGWISVDELSAAVQVIDIRARADHLRCIEHEIDRERGRASKYKATVVVCTYHRNKKIIDTLDALVRQSAAPQDFEILIVNNDPRDTDLAKIVQDFRGQYFQSDPERLKLIDCWLQGLSFARNVGIGAAQGEYICFIDDDAVPETNWLSLIISAFDQHPDAGLIGGHIRLKIPDPRPTALFAGQEGKWSQFITNFKQYTEVEDHAYLPWGANWCARRLALLDIGGFRTRYGRVGNDYSGGEELVAGILIKSINFKVAIVPQAEVKHCVDDTRYTLEHLKRTIIAARIINYRMQLDLYLPKNTSIQQSVAYVLFSRFKKFSNVTDKILNKYETRAYWILLKEQIKTLFDRFTRKDYC